MPLEHISHRGKRIIQTLSSLVLSVPNPRDFQFVGAHYCAFNDDTLLAVIRHTTDGKYLISQIVGILRRAVYIYLADDWSGGDQVEQSTVEHNLKLYHVNDHKNEDARLFISRLENMTKEEAKYVTIKLLLGLTARTGTKWGPVLDKLTQIRTNIVLWHRWIS